MNVLTERDGRALPAHEFALAESRGSLTTEILLGLFHGNLVAVLVREAVALDVCREIVTRYRTSPHLRRRSDGVPASYVGTYHYLKHPGTYIEECVARQPQVEALTQGLRCPVRELKKGIRAAAENLGKTFRQARYNGNDTIPFVAREWEGRDEHLLCPHEDLSQLRSDIQKGFEISGAAAYAPISFNLFLSNKRGRGRTIIWNLIPSRSTVDQLGLAGVGYPIPGTLLSELPSLAAPVGTGDVLAFNSSFVHAVEGIDSGSTRATLAFSAAIISSTEIVAWT